MRISVSKATGLRTATEIKHGPASRLQFVRCQVRFLSVSVSTTAKPSRELNVRVKPARKRERNRKCVLEIKARKYIFRIIVNVIIR